MDGKPLFGASGFGIILLIVALVVWMMRENPSQAPEEREGPGIPEALPAPPPAEDGYLFCFWNVENFFDDQFDGLTGPGDKKYDPEFANNEELRRIKLDRLTEVILSMNGGRGPDILALAEVEGERAARMLMSYLNNRLPPSVTPYTHLAYKDPKGGRHIATLVISRIPVDNTRTRLLKSRYRMLEAHLTAEGHKLIVVASHWSSRLSDRTGATRSKYADQIYGRYRAIRQASSEPIDFLVCGDFNDDPSDDSVRRHLHAVSDRSRLEAAGGPYLLNLLADQHDEETTGTLYYRGWHLFDQIVVSSGLLDDRGWKCLPETARIEKPAMMLNRKGKPRSFYAKTQKDGYGYSDHLPVTVRLKLP